MPEEQIPVVNGTRGVVAEKGEILRTQLGMAAGMPLIDIVAQAEADLGLAEEKSLNMVQRMDRCLGALGVAPTVPAVMDRQDADKKADKKPPKATAADARAQAHAQAAKTRCPCCVSKDGAYIYYEIPTKHHYVLPLCLHTLLCPGQGCDPQCEENGIFAHCAANVPICVFYGWIGWQSNNNWSSEGRPMCCWYSHQALLRLRVPAFTPRRRCGCACPPPPLHGCASSHMRSHALGRWMTVHREYRHCDCEDNTGQIPGPDSEIWKCCRQNPERV